MSPRPHVLLSLWQLFSDLKVFWYKWFCVGWRGWPGRRTKPDLQTTSSVGWLLHEREKNFLMRTGNWCEKEKWSGCCEGCSTRSWLQLCKVMLSRQFSLISVSSNGSDGSGCRPENGVPDLTSISNIDDKGINLNLLTRYKRDEIYVSGPCFPNYFVSWLTFSQTLTHRHVLARYW